MKIESKEKPAHLGFPHPIAPERWCSRCASRPRNSNTSPRVILQEIVALPLDDDYDPVARATRTLGCVGTGEPRALST
jgi:hypothetical protein